MANSKSKPPGRYNKVKEAYPDVVGAYEQLGEALAKCGPLSAREQRLVKLGLAFGSRSEGASHASVRKAMDAGLGTQEIEQAALLSITTLGFPNAMMFLSWAQDEFEKREG